MMSSASLRLIGPASFRSFRCLWMLEELGVAYEHDPANPLSKEVAKFNPLRKVPVLVQGDGFVLYESAAINTYLGDKFRDLNLHLVPPAYSRERALYDQTISVLISELDAQGLWIQRKHEGMGDLFMHIPDAVKHARKYFHKTNRALIKQLKENDGPYIMGTHFTAADIMYVHCLDWSKTIGWDEKWKQDEVVVDYFMLCKQRPAFQKVRAMRSHEVQEAAKRANPQGSHERSKL